jgi:hypothetical protein
MDGSDRGLADIPVAPGNMFYWAMTYNGALWSFYVDDGAGTAVRGPRFNSGAVALSDGLIFGINTVGTQGFIGNAEEIRYGDAVVYTDASFPVPTAPFNDEGSNNPITLLTDVPEQLSRVNEPFFLDTTVYFDGFFTPFTYTDIGGRFPWNGLTFSNGVISGVPVAVDIITNIVITGEDTAGNTVPTNGFTISTAAEPGGFGGVFAGTSEIIDFFVGSTAVQSVYVGNTIIWDRTPPTVFAGGPYLIEIDNPVQLDGVVQDNGTTPTILWTSNLSGAFSDPTIATPTFTPDTVSTGYVLTLTATPTTPPGPPVQAFADLTSTNVIQQVEYTADDTWICPDNVFLVSVCCIGGGGNDSGAGVRGGGGGGLGWTNDIPVIPGNPYVVEVGQGGTKDTPFGGTSFFDDANTVSGIGGNGSAGGNFNGDDGRGGGTGGQGSGSAGSSGGGGGGAAGGYKSGGSSPPGGQGNATGGTPGFNGSSGSGGSGGGANRPIPSGDASGGAGGGTGAKGQGSNGSAGSLNGGDGGAGSGGDGTNRFDEYGGGTGGGPDPIGLSQAGGGVVRIMWGGGRSYPLNAGDI